MLAALSVGQFLLINATVPTKVKSKVFLEAHLKTFLLLSSQLPQFPFSPLMLKTKPMVKTLKYTAGREKVIADLYIPNTGGKKPAIIIAMGVRQQKKKHLQHFMDSLARLGFVVIWPRMQKLENAQPFFEQSQTFTTTFLKLKEMNFVDKKRISLFGVSTGASVAFVAAADPKIAKAVKNLVFFGGYFDIFEYVKNLKEKKADGKKWIPHKLAVLESRAIAKQSISFKNPLFLKSINPSSYLDCFRAKIFILHDKSDSYVPYHHSKKLHKELNGHTQKTMHISDLFNHVHPKTGFNLQMIPSFIKLYKFSYKALSAI